MATTFNRIAPAPNSPSLASRVTALVRDVGALVRDHVELAALDAHRAAIGFTKALTAAVVAVHPRRHGVAELRRERHRLGH